MDRLVPLLDPRRRGLIRLGEVPSLFSEGRGEDQSPWLVLPSLDEIKARLEQIFQPGAE
jgi:hypothetical protein